MRSPTEIRRAHDLLAAIAADEAHVVFMYGCLDVLAWVMGEGGAAFGEFLQGIEILAVANGTPTN